MKAILLQNKYQKSENLEYYIEETKNLASALNIEIIEVFVQSIDKQNKKTYMNKGKVEDVSNYIKAYNETADDEDEDNIDLVIIGEEVTALVEKNLKELLKVKVVDRTNLILDIFNIRANSKEAKLQIQIATLEYNLGKIIGSYSNLSKQRGTSGGGISRGSGEKKLELDRRIIKDKIARLKTDLAGFDEHRNSIRNKRKRSNLSIISVVGYTNVGKSTFMNSFVDEDKKVLDKDQLFATLDTTVRKIELKNKQEVLLVDTVGFVSNLPHNLISAFSSTLQEVKYSDIIIHLKDASDSNKDIHEQVVKQTLKDLKVDHIPTLQVYNKSDLIDDKDEQNIYISAKNKQGYDELFKELEKLLNKDLKLVEIKLTYDQIKDYNYLRSNFKVLKEEMTDEGILLKLYLDEVNFQKYKNNIIGR